MTLQDKTKLLGWTNRLIALRAAAKGTSMYQEALALKAELMERAELRDEMNKKSQARPDEEENLFSIHKS